MTADLTENTEITMTGSVQPTSQSSHEERSGKVPTSSAHSVNVSPRRSSNGSATYELQEQEAQDALIQRIEKLCQDLWPSPTSIKYRLRSSRPAPQTPQIHYLKGGDTNHITSITLPSSYKEGHCNLILRLIREREFGTGTDQQVATLSYIRQRTSIAVPTIEATDLTCKNAVGKPYVLQHRMSGRDLESVWADLSHPQRCVVAKEMGRLIETLLSVESPLTGAIGDAGSGSRTSAELPNVVPFILKDEFSNTIKAFEPNNTIRAEASRSRQSTLEFFEYYFSSWKRFAPAKSRGEIECKLYDDMLNVVREMNDLGLFRPDLNCLCYLNLYPNHIMVEIDSEDSIQVTGFLDWDEAVFAPKFVNCQPPGWLWGYDENTHMESGFNSWQYEREVANHTPSTLEQQELKLIFDENAGPEYPRLAYDESSRLIRKLYELAMGSEDRTEGERIVKEWNVLRPTLIHGL